VKEIGQLGGDVSHFVSTRVAKRLAERFGIAAKIPAKSGAGKR